VGWVRSDGVPGQTPTVDLHRVSKRSKFDTSWQGVSPDVLLAEVTTEADFAPAVSYGGYTTNLPLEDLLHDRAWIEDRYEGDDIPPDHAGPARLLVPVEVREMGRRDPVAFQR
jgi:DMSO/TMAO reductase YedYZ molybdopterin-dependent catalytic subunit